MEDKPTDKFGEYLRSEGVEAEIKGRVAKRVAALDIEARAKELAAREWYVPGAYGIIPVPADNWIKEARGCLSEAATTIERYREALEKAVDLLKDAPMPADILTRQEYRDAKGNWRSLIDQCRNWIIGSHTFIATTTALSHAPEGQPGDGK